LDLLLTLILSCSVHLDDSLVEALSYKLSAGNQYFVGDLTTLQTYDAAKSVADARRIVESIKAAGGRPAIGLMAIPVEWAARFAREPDDLFDGCTNIAVGTSMLSDFARRCTIGPARHRPRSARRRAPRPTAALRTCVLRRLETEMNIQGIVQHVVPVIARLEAAPADRDADPPAARAPLFPDNTDTSQDGRDWSNPRLFLSSPTALAPPLRGPAAFPPTPTTSLEQPSPRGRGPAPGPRAALRRATSADQPQPVR
jgi:hypothetical protein